jgi:hypothetical protein
MKRGGTYWQERVLLDDIRSTFAWLEKMERQTIGEPKWYPFHAAANEMWALGNKLEEQLDAAGRNSYYQRKQED